MEVPCWGGVGRGGGAVPSFEQELESQLSSAAIALRARSRRVPLPSALCKPCCSAARLLQRRGPRTSGAALTAMVVRPQSFAEPAPTRALVTVPGATMSGLTRKSTVGPVAREGRTTTAMGPSQNCALPAHPPATVAAGACRKQAGSKGPVPARPHPHPHTPPPTPPALTLRRVGGQVFKRVGGGGGGCKGDRQRLARAQRGRQLLPQATRDSHDGDGYGGGCSGRGGGRGGRGTVGSAVAGQLLLLLKYKEG
jgi:hypothetical protein